MLGVLRVVLFDDNNHPRGFARTLACMHRVYTCVCNLPRAAAPASACVRARLCLRSTQQVLWARLLPAHLWGAAAPAQILKVPSMALGAE
jgi:hypothetical protein